MPGDDLRYLDWKAYGKSDKYYIKEYEEETNFRALIAVDTSESMRYQSGELPSKLDYAKVMAASLAYLIQRQSDSAGPALVYRAASQFSARRTPLATQ